MAAIFDNADLGFTVNAAESIPASNGSAPAENNDASNFDLSGWQTMAQNVLLGLTAGKIKKQYGLDLSNHLPYQQAPNGALAQMGGQAAYGVYQSGAMGNALQAAGFIQQNWPMLLGVGAVALFLLLRK